LIKWSDLLQQVLQESEGRRAILQLLSYLAIVVPELDLQTLIIKVRQASPEASEVVMTLAEQLIEQGKSQGFNDGKIQGFNEGQRELARRLLEKKFGQLPAWACQKLASASEELLENYLDRLITTSSLSEVLGN
jgi:flagellar biosynthesis/type III secretory pathway protein FliH